MQKLDPPKNPAPQDWHRADIKAALEKAGCSLSSLALANGYARCSGSRPLWFPWPKMERLIATAIGVAPHEIWPSRYREDGTPKSCRNERGLGRYKRKGNGNTAPVNGNANNERSS